MGFNKILIPLDGSDLAEAAVAYAIEAANSGAHIHLLSVVDVNCFTEVAIRDIAGMDIVALDKNAEVAADASDTDALEVFTRQKYLLLVAQRLQAKGFTTTVELKLGSAIHTIPSVVAEGFDVIVMSTHGRTGLREVLLGSVAKEVLHRARCPMLIVPVQHLQPSPVN